MYDLESIKSEHFALCVTLRRIYEEINSLSKGPCTYAITMSGRLVIFLGYHTPIRGV